MASNADGSVLAAGALPGPLLVSRDSGATWTAGAGLPNASWISIDISASGTAMVAVSYAGSMYRSTDSGQNWTQIDASFNTGGLNYESVSIADDGLHIVAVDQAITGVANSGSVYVSDNGGTTWTVATGYPAGGFWRAIDSSATGQVVVAADHNGGTFSSNDYGHTFTPLAVTVNGTGVQDGWYRLALSRDGTTVALAGNQQYGKGGSGTGGAAASTGIYVGRNTAGTWSWTQGSTVAGNYGAVTMSADGRIIGASLYAPSVAGGAPGQVLLSNDHGASFTQLTTPASTTNNWRSLAVNGLGTKLLLGEGDFATGSAGQLYLSSGTP